MHIKKYALHEISQPDRLDFNPDDYSRFKYGDDAVSRVFGSQLAAGFIEKHLLDEYDGQQIVVLSSPYSFIPTATFAMKNHFVAVLNRWLAEQEYPVVQEAKIHRTITYKEDYGELDAEQRMQLIGNDSFELDAAFLSGKTLVFLDDIRITGSHERMILKTAKAYNLTNDAYLLYYAELVNKDIHPRFENYLNYHCVHSIFDLHDIVNSPDFKINTRIVKYLLNCETEDFKKFTARQSEAFLNLLYDRAIGNGYHTIEAYTENFNFLKTGYIEPPLQTGERQTTANN